MKTCCYCKQEFSDPECRPYGIDKADTCFPCAMLPENRELSDKHMHEAIDEALALGNGNIYIGHHSGPLPMTPSNKDAGNN